MTTVDQQSPLVHYCPGAVVKDGRLVRLGKLKGVGLHRMLKRTAAERGMAPEHLHGYFVRIAVAKAQGRWPDDIAGQTAVLNGRR